MTQPVPQPAAPKTDWKRVHPDLRMAGEDESTGFTCLLMGELGTWKTSFAATAPNPLFLSILEEGGDEALKYVPELYGVAQPPSFRIKKKQQMSEYIGWIEQNAKALGFCTIVVDPLNGYQDLWISELMKKRRDAGMAEDQIAMQQQDWGAIEMHLVKDLMPRLHRTGLNVIWICHEDTKYDRPTKQQPLPSARWIGPMLQGAAAKKLPINCKMVLRATKLAEPDMQVPGHYKIRSTFWTMPSGLDLVVRHKYGNSFPEGKLVPEPGMPYATFYDIYKRIPWAVYAGQNQTQQAAR